MGKKKNKKARQEAEWDPRDLTLSQAQRTARMFGGELVIEVTELPALCKNCGNEILVMCFKGTDWCSDNCRKALKGDDARVGRN